MYLIDLFNRLNTAKINYAVLRGYESLPDYISHDIDFCIDIKDVPKAFEIIDEVLTNHGFNKIHSSRRKDIFKLYYYGKNECLKLDCLTGFTYKGLRYLELSKILEQTKTHNNIVVLKESAEVTLSFLKEFLHNGLIREDKIDLLQHKLQSEGLLNSDYFYADNEGIKNFESYLRDSKMNLKDEAKKYRKWLFLKNIQTDGLFITLSNMCKYIFLYLLDLFKRKGFFIILIGPDGSGKTTAAKAIIDNIQKKTSCFTSSEYMHGRPGLFPALSFLVGRGRSQSIKKMDFNIKNTTPMNQCSKKRIIMYMTYYYFDFLFGALKIFFKKFPNKIVIADRYFYDYFISGHFSNYPRLMYLLYTKLLPSPDLVIFMNGDPKSIHDRKPELTVEAIKNQQENIQNLLPDIKDFVIIDTQKDFLAVNNEINDAICNRLRSRAMSQTKDS